MNAPGQQQMHRSIILERCFQQYIHGALPQHEAASRTDVTTTFPALHHEAPRPLPEELRQQTGRWHMQVGWNAFLFQGCCLAGTATGNQGPWDTAGTNGGQLFLTQRRGHKTQNTHTPRPVTQQCLGLFQELAYLGLPKQGQGQERQGTIVSHDLGKGCRITHPGHGTLDDRIPGSVTGCHALPGTKWAFCSGLCRCPQGSHGRTHAPKTPTGRPTEGYILTQGQGTIMFAQGSAQKLAHIATLGFPPGRFLENAMSQPGIEAKSFVAMAKPARFGTIGMQPVRGIIGQPRGFRQSP